ncbi:MAG: hypothetical protein HY712_07560 [candidate division NC10 bacterium]|nr:hypothetical protein [candidate division NC10 bacterium]
MYWSEPAPMVGITWRAIIGVGVLAACACPPVACGWIVGLALIPRLGGGGGGAASNSCRSRLCPKFCYSTMAFPARIACK